MAFRATEHLPDASGQSGCDNLRDGMSTPIRKSSFKRLREAYAESPTSPCTPPCQDAIGVPAWDRPLPPDADPSQCPAILDSATSLIRAASQSPLILSALGALNRRGASLSEDSRGGTHTSLAVVLALARRAGCEAEQLKREDLLLTLLWIADSWMDAHRSSATTALLEYLAPLCHAQPQVASRLADIVPTLVRSMVGLQAVLLPRLGWRLRLHPDADLGRAAAALSAVRCANPGGGGGRVRAMPLLAARVQHGAPAERQAG
uniref:Uncharacterized protein n=2 Tax=Auxenochlorella protothecoides TaxID=3075 RepID=A0A1D2A8P3_AUXPR